MTTKIGFCGYGNLTRGLIKNLKYFPDLELIAIFSRRPESVQEAFPVCQIDRMAEFKDRIDIMIMCGGSATDLPVQSPEALKYFNIVDSFDTHAKIPRHFEALNKAGRESGRLGCLSGGWDPGLFSMTRLIFNSFLPNGTDYTFWGKGVSQGHSDAIRRLDGVKKGIQYTVPKIEALNAVRAGGEPKLTTRDKHLRECFVVAEKGADLSAVEKAIVTMPDYFSDYDTVVHFIDEETFCKEHNAMPHGGLVMRSGETGGGAKNLLELSIMLESNPEFTSSVLLSLARAVAAMSKQNITGAVTVFDIPLKYLSASSNEDLRKNLL